MPIALNTADPLYPSLTYFFAVDDDNTVKEFKAGLVTTTHPSTLLPNSLPTPSSSAPYGRSFKTAAGATNYTFPGGVTFAGADTPVSGPISVFVVLNKFNGASADNPDLVGGSGPLVRLAPGSRVTTAMYPGQPTSGAATAAALSTGANTICVTRNGNLANSVFIYLNGALDANFAGGLSNANGQFGSYPGVLHLGAIGGWTAASWVSADVVFVAVFVGKQLTAADAARLHASLTGGNAFALVQSGVLAFNGTVPNKNGTLGAVFSWGANALAGYFSGGTPALSYAVQTGSLPPGLAINTGTAVISGTPTSAGSYPVTVRATDSLGATVDSNAFNIVVAGGAGDTTPPTLVGVVSASAVTSTGYTLAWPAGSDNVAVTGYERSLDGGSTWLAVGNVLTTSITGRTPGSTDAVRVRAFDAAGNRSTPPLPTDVTLLPAAGSASIVSQPFKNAAGTLLPNLTIPKLALLRVSDLALVLTLANQATDGAAVLSISHAALSAGTRYLLVTLDATATVFGCEPYTAV